MKKLPFLIYIACFSCSEPDKKGLNEILNNNSFEWHITKEDTSIVPYRMHFFQDSLYVTVFKDPEGIRRSQVGTWNVKGNPKNPALWLSNRISGSYGEFTVKSYERGTVNFAYVIDHYAWDSTYLFFNGDTSYRFKAVQIEESQRPDVANYLLGSWYAPGDSTLNSLSEWKRTGKLNTNSTFRFTKDSFDIRTAQFREKGLYRIIHCGHDIIILESERLYFNNPTIDIDHVDSTEFTLRFDMRWDKKFWLIRNGT